MCKPIPVMSLIGVERIADRDIANTTRGDGGWDIGAWEAPPVGAADAGPEPDAGAADASPAVDAIAAAAGDDDGCDCHSTRSEPGLPGSALAPALLALVLRREKRAR